jgi:hypothetical protein
MMTTGISFQKGAGVLEDQGFGGKGEGGRGEVRMLENGCFHWYAQASKQGSLR